MYQQPLTQAFSTKEIFHSLTVPIEDDRKLTGLDILLTLAQVLGLLAICWGLHSAGG